VYLGATVVKFCTRKNRLGQTGGQRCTIKLFQPAKGRIIRDLSESVRFEPSVIQLMALWSWIGHFDVMKETQAANLELLRCWAKPVAVVTIRILNSEGFGMSVVRSARPAVSSERSTTPHDNAKSNANRQSQPYTSSNAEYPARSQNCDPVSPWCEGGESGWWKLDGWTATWIVRVELMKEGEEDEEGKEWVSRGWLLRIRWWWRRAK